MSQAAVTRPLASVIPYISPFQLMSQAAVTRPLASVIPYISPFQLMSQAAITCPVEVMESEDPSFMLYTSGSTGKPKGIQHSTAGYLLYSSFTHKVS